MRQRRVFNIYSRLLSILSALDWAAEPNIWNIQKLKAAAYATALKDRRANIRLSSIDLTDIQVKALEEGVPYQTLIASVLHKYVTGRFVEKSQRVTSRSTRTPRKRVAG